MRTLNSPVLVLNKSWAPMHIKPVKDTIIDICTGRAKTLDPETGILHGWDDWCNLEAHTHKWVIHGVKKNIRIPEIIVLNDYNKMPDIKVKLSRRNIFLRDAGVCQYCTQKVTMSNFTIDHVVPKSKGGKAAWDNYVTCCRKCNTIKADKTLKEVNFTLMHQPKKPKFYPLAARFSLEQPESWIPYLPKNQQF
jgi:5-methylcytosine-specific restriction endonuclease McrA